MSTIVTAGRRKKKSKDVVNVNKELAYVGINDVGNMPISIVDDQLENSLSKYDTQIENYRKKNDFVWMFLDGKEIENKNMHLRDLLSHLNRSYGPIKPKEKQIPEDLFKVIDNVILGNDSIEKDLLFFAEIYLDPGIFRWFLNGVPENNIPPPPLTDRGRFKHFVINVLPRMFEAFLSGTKEMTVESFVRHTRTQIVCWCGLPEQPPEARVSMYNQYIKSKKARHEDSPFVSKESEENVVVVVESKTAPSDFSSSDSDSD